MAAMQSLPPRRKTPASSVPSWQAETNLGGWPIGAIARRLPADAHAIAPDVLAVPAGLVEDVRLRRLACRALALQPAALPRSFVQPMREQ